jgi:hypothetical protein
MQQLEAARISQVPDVQRAAVCLAWLGLVAADVVMKLAGFQMIHRAVTRWPLSAKADSDCTTTGVICAAVDRAATYYFKHARCLQRSAVTTCLLRRRGVPAQMIIGCRKMPFHGHAWVEVDGKVINDTQQVQKFYSELDRW